MVNVLAPAPAKPPTYVKVANAIGLDRHRTGDWGDVGKDDHRANERALKDNDRLFSVYHSAEGAKFWIITEWDRSQTTLMLPEDY